MKRIVARVLLFLLLGAVINVAVAWGCALWAPLPADGYALEVPPHLRGSLYPGTRRAILESLFVTWDHFEPISEKSFDAQGVLHGVGSTMVGLPHRALVWYELDERYEGTVTSPSWRHGLPPPLKPPESRWPYRRLPILPILSGFALNTIFYGLSAWVAVAAPRVVRQSLRYGRGLCIYCTYPIGTSPVCTECGKPVLPRAEADA